MDLSHPFAIVTPTLDGDILRVLAGAEADFTSGDVHRILNGPSIRGIHNSLTRLSEQGIVLRQPAGRAFLYRLNRHHLGAPHIIALAHLRDELLGRLSDEVRSWRIAPTVAAVFGSAVRRDHSASSDIDILLVCPDDADEAAWDQQSEALSQLVTTWTGNDCRILSLTFSQARKGAQEVIANVVREGVVLCGDAHLLIPESESGQRI